MTKKLLLTAAAIGAMAFAGAANAGVLSTTSKVSGVTVNAGVTGTPAASYVIASEYAFPSAGLATDYTAAANIFEFGTLTNEINVDKDATGLTFVVTYELTGPVKFENVSSAAVTLGTLPGTVTPVLSNGGKTLKVFVTVSGNGSATVKIDKVHLSNFDLAVSGKEAAKVSYTLQQVIAGQNVDLDVSNAATIVAFSSVFDDFFKASTGTVLAALNDFETFKASGMTGGVTVPVGGATATTATWSTTTNTVYTDLKATPAGALSTIITGAEVTLTGPQVEALDATVGGVALPGDATATSAKYALTAANLDANLVLTAAADTAIAAGTYDAEIKPTYAANWSGPTTIDRTLLRVGLDGTNFYAPWFALDNGAANSTLRLANNGSSAIGPVVVSLKASNGTAATGTYTIPSIAPGAFVSVRGDQLKTAFGTTAANGDLMITVQSQDSGLSAKVRTTQASGQIYENSLGNGSQALVN